MVYNVDINIMNTFFDLINKEKDRQLNTFSLIPSENIVSENVLAALGSCLTNKYSEGYPEKRYYNGNSIVDIIEMKTIELAKKLFNVEYANVQAYSGSPANLAIYFALLEPGDTVLGLNLGSGGHLTHGANKNFSSRFYNAVNYYVNANTHFIDYDTVRKLALEHKPKMIIAGLTAYPRNLDFKKFKEIADEVGAFLLADISHISGLVISNLHESPVGLADVIMTTTHKQLRGPRGALILTNNFELSKKINSAIMPGLQGGPHNNVTAAIGVALEEALDPSYKLYCQDIIKNRIIIENILKENEIRMITGGSDNHLLLIDVGFAKGKIVADDLESKGIIVNANSIPFDESTPFKPSGIRIGTPCITTQKVNEKAVEKIARELVDSIKKFE